jgi:hypothetical protein
MITLVIGLVVGILIGWNWAQPPWAKTAQTRFISFVSSSNTKVDQ